MSSPSADMRSTTPGSSSVTENGMRKTSPQTDRQSNTTYEQSQNQAQRSTTGTADRSASASEREARRTSEATSSTSDLKNSTPEAVNNNNSNMAQKNEADWLAAEKIAGNMDKSCHIDSQTSSFALRLPDGRMVQFDDASNAKIASQLQSTNRVGNSAKIFRVIVDGTMQGDRIALTSIKM